ncbi:MAG: hypothetical protein ACUZ77_02310 [Candidatus Brocadiales bacterium]
MKVLKWFLMFICVFALSAVVSYPTYAQKVKSGKGNKCKGANNFKTTQAVRAKGKKLAASTNVDIYVTSNKTWTGGETLTDVSGGVETVATNGKGKTQCTTIWNNPIAGTYDIVVDVNQSGTFDVGIDAVDGKSENPGFKVKEKGAPEVKSARKKGKKCKDDDEFSTSEDIHAKAKGLPKNSTVDVYVVADKDWTGGEIITGTDATTNGVESATTNKKGRLKCESLGSTGTAGAFDIIVDVDQDGTFDLGTDAVDGRKGSGLRVK